MPSQETDPRREGEEDPCEAVIWDEVGVEEAMAGLMVEAWAAKAGETCVEGAGANPWQVQGGTAVLTEQPGMARLTACRQLAGSLARERTVACLPPTMVCAILPATGDSRWLPREVVRGHTEGATVTHQPPLAAWGLIMGPVTGHTELLVQPLRMVLAELTAMSAQLVEETRTLVVREWGDPEQDTALEATATEAQGWRDMVPLTATSPRAEEPGRPHPRPVQVAIPGPHTVAVQAQERTRRDESTEAIVPIRQSPRPWLMTLLCSVEILLFLYSIFSIE